MSSEVIPPAKPYFPRPDIDLIKEDLDKILSSGRMTLGEYTKEFERIFAESVNVRHAIAVNSGTSALEISMRAYKLKKGDEVIVPTNTFGATAAAVVFAGGQPVVTDVSRSSMTIDVHNVKRAISGRTRGVVAVHIGGLVCPEINEIKELCEERGLFLIEDAAHAHGSRIDGKSAGSIGSAGCFSFYPTKVITSGEGGMITTNEEKIANAASILRDQGKENFSSNRIVQLGFNWRMPEICAATGITQFRRLSEFIERRNTIAKLYNKALDEIEIDHITTPPNHVNNYYKYTFFLPSKVDRDRFKELCKQDGVLYGGEVYWPPLHLQPAFRPFLRKEMRFAVADDLCRRMVNPPMFSQMTIEQAQRVMDVSRTVLSNRRG